MSHSEQLKRWRGEFGDAYTQRNAYTAESMESRRRWFEGVLRKLALPSRARILEVGANIGLNLLALSELVPARFHGVDANEAASRILKQNMSEERPGVSIGDVLHLPYRDNTMDLVLTCGLLIHIHPDRLRDACAELLRVSRKYVLCAEYYSYQPEEVVYRGERGILFKRDFGGFMLDHWPDLRVVDYGFLWKRMEFDDITWWLFAMQKD